MVLEVTGIGQLEFGPGTFSSFLLPSEADMVPAVGAVEMWESGALWFFAGFPSPVERAENSFWAFGVFHAFHGAAFPPLLAQGFLPPRSLRIDSPRISMR